MRLLGGTDILKPVPDTTACEKVYDVKQKDTEGVMQLTSVCFSHRYSESVRTNLLALTVRFALVKEIVRQINR